MDILIVADQVTIDKCEVYESVWLDYGEVSQIIDRKEKKFPIEEKTIHIRKKGKDESTKENYKCPKCNKIMERFNYAVICKSTMERSNFLYTSGIIIDHCKNEHGEQ
ncbi:MAG: hypothetical protein GY714_17240 [Desulfobacterales bacterium]|nr:hypothetical protein [Desulfobacterales bacterium]